QRKTLPVTPAVELNITSALSSIPIRITVNNNIGVHMTLFVYRSPGQVSQPEAVRFDPPQVHHWEDTRPYSNSPWASFWVPPAPPEDNRWIADVVFNEPGTYTLKGRADDGGLFTDVLV